MLIYTRARAEDVRALAGAIVLGSGAGLLMGGAFLATTKPSAPAPTIGRAPAGQAVAGRAVASAAPAPAPAPSAAPLRARFALQDLTRQVARPFHFADVAAGGSDLNCLTQAVYFEARGEQKAGQQAVAQVVLNRVRHPAFPKTICGVVHQHNAGGCQFTFACSTKGDAVADNSAWRHAQTIAQAALHGFVMQTVGDATHFQTARGGAFEGLLKVAQIGAHVFYRFGGHAGAADMFHQTPTPSVAVAKVETAKVETAKVETARADAAKPAAPAAIPAKIEATKAGLAPAETAKLALATVDAAAAKAPAAAAAPARPAPAAPVKQAAASPETGVKTVALTTVPAAKPLAAEAGKAPAAPPASPPATLAVATAGA